MVWGILQRMIFWELLKIFSLSLVGITGIIVMAGIVAEANQQGLSLGQIVTVMPLLIPSFLPYTIPATTLFATCVVYGRLAHDNEILAIKAAGVSILRVVSPSVVLGLVMSGITLGLYYDFIPRTYYMLRTRFLSEVEEVLYDMLKRDRYIKRPKLPYVIYVRQVQGTRLVDALFKRQEARGPGFDVIAQAREAELRVDMAHGQMLVHMRDGDFLSEDGQGKGHFREHNWSVPLPPELGSAPKPKARALTWRGILERRPEVRAEAVQLELKIEEEKQWEAIHGPRTRKDDTNPDLPILRQQARGNHLELFALNTELQMRPAISLGCLCFVMVGCPIGIWFSRSDYLSAFITCFLPIAFLYYPILMCTANLARLGHQPIFIWSADGLMLLTSMVLFRQLLKH